MNNDKRIAEKRKSREDRVRRMKEQYGHSLGLGNSKKVG